MVNLENFKKDFFASIVVFLVAIPLCLGIAIASGVSAEAGLISGIIGGIVVGALSGCPLQVSGPAAGLVAIVFEIIQKYGIQNLGPILVFAGLIQISFGMLGLGIWFKAVSPAVVHGMLAGIGVLIFSSQFHVMIDDLPQSKGFENIFSIPSAVIKAISINDGLTHHLAAFIGILTILVIILWSFAPPRLKIIPPPLAGVITATVLCSYLELPIKYVTIPGNFLDVITPLSLNNFNELLDWSILFEAIAIAFIASAETLLSSAAVEKMMPSSKTNYNKEIIAQGVGNSLAGLLGALPITGVIVRSSANVMAGAKTRLSAILHGIWLLIFIVFFPTILKLVPIASLAAILVYTGYKLMDLKVIKSLYKYGKVEVLIYLATISVIVFDSLLEGVIVGLFLSVVSLLYKLSHVDITLEDEKEEIFVRVKGSASFVCLPKLASTLDKIPVGRTVFVCLDEAGYVDHACMESLINWEKQYQKNGGTVFIEWDKIESRFFNKTKTKKPVSAT